MNWILMPFRDCWPMTQAAILDLLTQVVDPPTQILLINNGSTPEIRRVAEEVVQKQHPRTLLWSHTPPLLSLSATWNHALDFVWAIGGEHALVVNNDVRCHPAMYQALLDVQRANTAYFVSAIGVTLEQFEAFGLAHPRGTPVDVQAIQQYKGGPGFSCFLYTKAAHAKYRFDEGYQPSYCEDLDMHRRMMLAGDGPKIFSVDLPYHHLGSKTLEGMDEETRSRWLRSIQMGSRAYYEKKWGGPVNEEKFWVPFNQEAPLPYKALTPHQPTTPYLQHEWSKEATEAISTVRTVRTSTESTPIP